MHYCFMKDAQKIKQRISWYTKSTPFTTEEFSDISNRMNISKVLSRMTQKGEIERVERGVYRRLFNASDDEV